MQFKPPDPFATAIARMDGHGLNQRANGIAEAAAFLLAKCSWRSAVAVR
jgi:hypothetical protein